MDQIYIFKLSSFLKSYKLKVTSKVLGQKVKYIKFRIMTLNISEFSTSFKNPFLSITTIE